MKYFPKIPVQRAAPPIAIKPGSKHLVAAGKTPTSPLAHIQNGFSAPSSSASILDRQAIDGHLDDFLAQYNGPQDIQSLLTYWQNGPGKAIDIQITNGSLIAPSFVICAREVAKKNPIIHAIFIESLAKSLESDASALPYLMLAGITYHLLTQGSDYAQSPCLKDAFNRMVQYYQLDNSLLEAFQKAQENEDLCEQIQSWGSLTQALVDQKKIDQKVAADLLAFNIKDWTVDGLDQTIDDLSEKIKTKWIHTHAQQAHAIPSSKISGTRPPQNLAQTPASGRLVFDDVKPVQEEPIEKKSAVEEAQIRKELLTYMTKRGGWTGNRSYRGKRLLNKLFPKNLSQKAQQDPKVWEKARMRARVVFECMREAGTNNDNPDHPFLFHGEKKGPFKDSFNPADLNRFFDDLLAVGADDPIFLKSFLRELTDVTWPAPIRKIAWANLKTYADANPSVLTQIETSIIEHMLDRKNGHAYRSIGRSDAVLFLMQQYDADEQKEFIDRLALYLTDRRMTGHLALDITHGLKRALPKADQQKPLAQAEPIKKLLQALRINLSKRSRSEASIRRKKLFEWGIYLAPLRRKIDFAPIDDSFDDDEADEEPMIIDLEEWNTLSPTNSYQSSSSHDVDDADDTDQPPAFDADEIQEGTDISSHAAPTSPSRRPAPERTKNHAEDALSFRKVFENLDGGGYPSDQKPFFPYMRPVREIITQPPAQTVQYQIAQEAQLPDDAAPQSPSRRPAPMRPTQLDVSRAQPKNATFVFFDPLGLPPEEFSKIIDADDPSLLPKDQLSELIDAYDNAYTVGLRASVQQFAEHIHQQPDENHLVTAAPMILDIEAARAALGDPASSQDEGLNDQLLIEVAQKKFQADDWEDALEDDPIHFSQVFFTAYLDHLNLISLPIVDDLMISPDQDASVWEAIQSEIMSPYLAWLEAVEDSQDVTEQLKAAPAIFEALTLLNEAYQGFTASIEALNEVRIAQQLDAIYQAFEAIKTHTTKLNRTLGLASIIAQVAGIQRSDSQTI